MKSNLDAKLNPIFPEVRSGEDLSLFALDCLDQEDFTPKSILDGDMNGDAMILDLRLRCAADFADDVATMDHVRNFVYVIGGQKTAAGKIIKSIELWTVDRPS